MPKENRKRGRRAEEKKRKLDVSHHDDGDSVPKRTKHRGDDSHQNLDISADYVPLHAHDAHRDEEMGEDQQYEAGSGNPADNPFYGLLDEEEQEYFHKAGDLLELNEFPSPDERDSFLASIYREADGKELKIANSQSCSRLLERLIQLSTPQQLKTLFQKFKGKYGRRTNMPLILPLVLTALLVSCIWSSTDSHLIAAKLSSSEPLL
jgi:nucleolar protein 9